MRNALNSSYRELRALMVENQLIARGIASPLVLNAFMQVPRHHFVPKAHCHLSYADQPLPIGFGQTISQPYIVAYMLEKLEVLPRFRVLEIGMGSGYQAALLATMGCEVYAIERHAGLIAQAAQNLAQAQICNIHYRCANGFYGWADCAPFDAIVIAAHCAEVPLPLMQQLRKRGRLIFPQSDVGSDAQYLMLLERTDSEWMVQRLAAVRFVPFILPGPGTYSQD